MEKISYLSYSDSANAFYHLLFIIYHLAKRLIGAKLQIIPKNLFKS